MALFQTTADICFANQAREGFVPFIQASSNLVDCRFIHLSSDRLTAWADRHQYSLSDQQLQDGLVLLGNQAYHYQLLAENLPLLPQISLSLDNDFNLERQLAGQFPCLNTGYVAFVQPNVVVLMGASGELLSEEVNQGLPVSFFKLTNTEVGRQKKALLDLGTKRYLEDIYGQRFVFEIVT